MTKEWLTYKLGDIAEVIDCPHSTPKWLDKGVFVIRSWNVRGGRLVFEKVSYTDELTYIERTRRAKPEPGDIVLTREAPMGEVCILPEGLKCCLGQRVVLLKPSKSVDNKFLFYTLQSPAIQNKIRSNDGTGSVVSNFRIPNIKTLELKLPFDINVQKSVSSVLSSLDDKIELNLQMNKTLEAIAQAIFKEWFVDFRFPGFDGKLVDGLPKGWKLKPFRDILALIKDGSHNPPQRVLNGIRFIAGATDIKDFYIKFDKCTYITKDDYDKIHKNWEIRANDILITIVGTIGNTAIVRENDLPFSLQRSIAVLRPIPEISHLYIYQIVKSKEFKNYLKSRTNPTGQPGVYLGTLSEYIALIPPKDILLKFHHIQSPLFEMMKRNITENQILIELRDLLIPKLMTGKIRVV